MCSWNLDMPPSAVSLAAVDSFETIHPSVGWFELCCHLVLSAEGAAQNIENSDSDHIWFAVILVVRRIILPPDGWFVEYLADLPKFVALPSGTCQLVFKISAG
jgi:hypothetical protein